MGYRGRRGRRSFDRPRGSRGKQGFNRGPTNMHKSVCADCGKECEVPFQPTGDRPVYCKECWAKRRPPRTEDNRRREEYSQESPQRRPSPTPENVDLQILAELKRIREVLEKGAYKEAETRSHQVHDKRALE
jgi:CxxC-x17-CxxC domain-containing protein